MGDFNSTISANSLDRLFRALLDCDCQDYLNWNTKWWDDEEANRDKLVFSICANDLFAWASAESVEVTDENIHLLEQAIKDLEALGGRWLVTILAPDLFCCRSEKCKPQPPWFPNRKKYLTGFGGDKLEFTEEQVENALKLFDVEGWSQHS